MPTPLPTDPVSLELAVREAVKNELLAAVTDWPLPTRPKIETRPRYVETEKEWLEIAAVKHPSSGLETRVCFLEFKGVTERDEGACNQTIITLNYGIDVLFALVDKRRDGSNSHDDFVAFVMRARASFKDNRTFGYARRELENKLLQTDTPARVEKTDFALVHRINLSLQVEIG